MKSKYTPLVALKQKALDLAETALIKANQEVETSAIVLENAYKLLSTLVLPSQGSLGELSQIQMMIHIQHREIEESRNRLQNAQNKQLHMRQEYKKAQIEFEKFSYLEVEEINRYRTKLRKEEDKMLDEIGTIMFKRGENV